MLTITQDRSKLHFVNMNLIQQYLDRSGECHFSAKRLSQSLVSTSNWAINLERHVRLLPLSLNLLLLMWTASIPSIWPFVIVPKALNDTSSCFDGGSFLLLQFTHRLPSHFEFFTYFNCFRLCRRYQHTNSIILWLGSPITPGCICLR